MDYFLQGFGVFLGVVAGTAVTILANWFLEKRSESQKISNLKFEINSNIERISKWQEQLSGWRDAVNGDSPNTWAVWLNFSHIMQGTAEEVFKSGLIYQRLGNESISKLQGFLADFSLAFEQLANQKIAEQRSNFQKQEAVMFIAYLDNKLRDAKNNLGDVFRELK